MKKEDKTHSSSLSGKKHFGSGLPVFNPNAAGIDMGTVSMLLLLATGSPAMSPGIWYLYRGPGQSCSLVKRKKDYHSCYGKHGGVLAQPVP
jgi:hypothetical protein